MKPAPGTPLFGFNDNSVPQHTASAADDARLTAGVGANTMRVTVDWRWAEPSKGDIHLDAYDALYKAMIAKGIRPILIPAFSPTWAMEPGTCNQYTTDCRYPPARNQAGAYASFAALLARRYPQAAAIEVWNEPNQKIFWRPAPDPARYADLLAAAYREIKRQAPGMTVLGGSVADNPSTSDGVPPAPYLTSLYRDGIANSMDGLSIHPYPELLDQTLGTVRSIRNAYGDSARKLWITETGYSTTGWNSATWPKWWSVSESGQASGLVAVYDHLAAMPDVAAVMVHTLIEPSGDRASTPGPGYGIVRQDRLTPKPAYCALARLRGGTGCG